MPACLVGFSVCGTKSDEDVNSTYFLIILVFSHTRITKTRQVFKKYYALHMAGIFLKISILGSEKFVFALNARGPIPCCLTNYGEITSIC